MKVKKKIDSASSDFGLVERRTRAISRKLTDVETLPENESLNLIDTESFSLTDDEHDVD